MSKSTCAVCGDVATRLYHQGELPCNLQCKSCRLFFSRNYTKRKSLVCANQNSCPITISSRRHCPKCRLEKCYTIGMTLSTSSSSGALSPVSLPRELDILPRWSPPSEPAYRRPLVLSPYERQCIQYISTSMAFFPNEPKLPLVRQVETLSAMTTLRPMYLYRLIDYLKRVPIYQTLPDERKLTILNGILEVFFPLRYAFQYSAELDSFVVLDENGGQTVAVKRYLCYELGGDLKGFEQNSTILIGFNRDIEGDSTVRDILIATLNAYQLWSCLGSDYLRYFYAINCHLLQRYLEDKYQDEDLAGIKYRQLMNLTFNQLKIAYQNYQRWTRQRGIQSAVFDNMDL